MTAPTLDKFKLPFSFAVNREQKEKLEETISSKDAGGASNGTTNDTTKINEALAVLGLLSYSVIFTIPFNTVYTESLLVIPDNVVIEDRSQAGKIRFITNDRGYTNPVTEGGVVVKSSGVSGILVRACDSGVPAAPYLRVINEDDGAIAGINFSFALATGYFDIDEIASPSAPGVNKGRLFVRDNGAGKSQLCVRFNTGAVQVIATEP